MILHYFLIESLQFHDLLFDNARNRAESNYCTCYIDGLDQKEVGFVGVDILIQEEVDELIEEEGLNHGLETTQHTIKHSNVFDVIL